MATMRTYDDGCAAAHSWALRWRAGTMRELEHTTTGARRRHALDLVGPTSAGRCWSCASCSSAPSASPTCGRAYPREPQRPRPASARAGAGRGGAAPKASPPPASGSTIDGLVISSSRSSSRSAAHGASCGSARIASAPRLRTVASRSSDADGTIETDAGTLAALEGRGLAEALRSRDPRGRRIGGRALPRPLLPARAGRARRRYVTPTARAPPDTSAHSLPYR